MPDHTQRCAHCALPDPSDTDHDATECARRVAAADRTDILRTLERAFAESAPERATARANALLDYWQHHIAEHLREHAAREALFGKEGIRLAADLIDPQVKP